MDTSSTRRLFHKAATTGGGMVESAYRSRIIRSDCTKSYSCASEETTKLAAAVEKPEDAAADIGAAEAAAVAASPTGAAGFGTNE
jgi:hypothetical protein